MNHDKGRSQEALILTHKFSPKLLCSFFCLSILGISLMVMRPEKSWGALFFKLVPVCHLGDLNVNKEVDCKYVGLIVSNFFVG